MQAISQKRPVNLMGKVQHISKNVACNQAVSQVAGLNGLTYITWSNFEIVYIPSHKNRHAINVTQQHEEL